MFFFALRRCEDVNESQCLPSSACRLLALSGSRYKNNMYTELSLYYIRYCIVFSQQGDKSELSGATLNFLPQQLIERAVRSLCRNSTCNVPQSFRKYTQTKSGHVPYPGSSSILLWVLIRCHRLIRSFQSLIGKSLFGFTMMSGIPPPRRALPLAIPPFCKNRK